MTKLLTALLCLIVCTSATSAGDTRPRFVEAHVQNSPGGEVDRFLQLLDAFLEDGTKVHISGYCASACTLFLTADACVYEDTRLGFHAPYLVSPVVPGARLYNPEMTAEFLRHYPPHIRQWLEDNGGLQPSLIWLEGPELLSLVPLCEGTPIV